MSGSEGAQQSFLLLAPFPEVGVAGVAAIVAGRLEAAGEVVGEGREPLDDGGIGQVVEERHHRQLLGVKLRNVCDCAALSLASYAAAILGDESIHVRIA